MPVEVLAHRIQFYDFTPAPFTCLARSNKNLIAAGREDGTVEVFDANRNFFMVAYVPASILKSVQSLCWYKDRLFSTGALGQLCEIDLATSSPKDPIILLGTQICRCLTVCGSNICVGNDEGFLALYTPDPTLTFVDSLPQLSGKVLSLAYTSKMGRVLAASTSSGLLVTIEITSEYSRIHHTLMSESSKTVVWSLLFNKGMLFSGDSTGFVRVWDVRIGSLLVAFSSHVSVVLTLTRSSNGKIVFSGGADGAVCRYDYCVSTDKQVNWEVAGKLRGCVRDICGLAYVPGQHYDPGSQTKNLDSRFEPHRLVAVGHDARLLLLACEQPERGVDELARAHRNFACHVGRSRSVAALPFWPVACCSVRPNPIAFQSSLRPQQNPNNRGDNYSRLCLCHYPNRLVLVQLAKPATTVSPPLARGIAVCSMSQGALRLADIRPHVGMPVISSCLSPCGRFIAYSDTTRTHILNVTISAATSAADSHIPSVTIKRVKWDSDGSDSRGKRRHSVAFADPLQAEEAFRPAGASVTSSSETDDTDLEDLSGTTVAMSFALDPPADLSAKTHSLSAEPFTVPRLGRSTEADVHLPSASSLSFTARSEFLILVTRFTHLICWISVETGRKHSQWSLSSEPDEDFRVQGMSILPTVTAAGHIVALLCSDGRVRLYSHLCDGHRLFTSPCILSASGCPPLPIAVAFYPTGVNAFSMSVMYTNSHLSEWCVTLTETTTQTPQESGSSHLTDLRVTANPNMWLSKFWQVMDHEICTTLGVFHSMAYMNKSTWLLASDRYLVLLTRDKAYEPGLVKKLLEPWPMKGSEHCMKICKDFESIIQATVLKRKEIALVSLHSAGIVSHLSAPLQRKQFGT